MPAEGDPRTWDEFADWALDELEAAQDSSVATVADEHLARALVLSVLACASAVAHYPADGWEPVKHTESHELDGSTEADTGKIR